jgi:tetratricopeptide (TPR) repeat protein
MSMLERYRLLKTVCLLILISVLGSVHAQEVGYLVKEGEQLEKAMKDEEALVKYEEAVKLSPNDLRARTKCSEMYSVIGHRLTDKKKRSEYFNIARTHAEAALRQDSLDADANYAMALALSRLAVVGSVKEKIQYVRGIKTFADASLKADPDHVKALYTVGKWHHEVSGLGFAEKAALRIALGGMPPASLAEAIENFEKARRLAPSFVANYLALALAYRDSGQSDKAIELLQRMVRLPPKSQDDAGLKEEGKKLLQSLL